MIITSRAWPSAIWPWPTTNRASGSIRRSCSVWASIVSTRLWTKNTCPPRSSSRRIASRTSPADASATRVWIGRRSSGGVSMTDMSRTPARARFSVRGIGVADSVRTSTSRRSCFSRSFAATPNRCSSSTTTRPRSRNSTSFDSSRCVPITRSTDPSSRPGDRPLLLGRADEPRQQPDLDRERREPLRERLRGAGRRGPSSGRGPRPACRPGSP